MAAPNAVITFRVYLRPAIREMCHGIRLGRSDATFTSMTNGCCRRTSRFVVEVFFIRDVCWRKKMAGMTRRSSLGNSQIHKTQDSLDRLRRLYPAVIDPENTLPRSWSPKDKHNFIGLTQNDLRVHYKGNVRCCLGLTFQRRPLRIISSLLFLRELKRQKGWFDSCKH